MPPYNVALYVYPPASLVVLSPLATLPYALAQAVFAIVNATAILAGSLLLLQAFNLDWRSWAVPSLLLTLAIFIPVQTTLDFGNINGLIYLGESVFVLMLMRQRWVLAGTSLGVSLMLKPVLLPLVVILVIQRQWKAGMLAVGIPVLASAAVLLMVKNPASYFTHTLPFLFSQVGPENVSVKGILDRIAAPGLVTVAARLIAAACAVGAFLWVWLGGRGSFKHVALVGILLSAAFLVSSPSWPYYGLYLLPSIVGVLVVPGAGRATIATVLVGAVLIGMPNVPALIRDPGFGFTVEHARFTLGFATLLAAATIWVRPSAVRTQLAAVGTRDAQQVAREPTATTYR